MPTDNNQTILLVRQMEKVLYAIFRKDSMTNLNSKIILMLLLLLYCCFTSTVNIKGHVGMVS